MDKYRILIIGLVSLLILFSLSQFKQNSLDTRSDQIFNIDKSDIFRINIHQGIDSLSLSFNGTPSIITPILLWSKPLIDTYEYPVPLPLSL